MAMSGRRIRVARRRLGETQAVFAKRFGVHQTTIHLWETYGLPDRGTTLNFVRRVLLDIEIEQDEQEQQKPAISAPGTEAAPG